MNELDKVLKEREEIFKRLAEYCRKTEESFRKAADKLNNN